MDDKEIKKEIEEITPPVLDQFAHNNVRSLNDLFPGPAGEDVRVALRQGNTATVRGKDGQEVQIIADVDADGNVFSMAAAVSRTPTKAETYLKDVPDLKTTGGLSRPQKIDLYHSIARNEGVINNALKKKGALVSQEGNFAVKTARSGKRPRKAVANDLLTLLEFWQANVNSAAPHAAVTGSRGLRQVIRRGSRQAMVEGDLFLREVWKMVPVPALGGKKFKLPVILQALPSKEVEVSEELVGMGIDLFYWIPSSEKIRAITSPSDKNIKKLVSDLVDSKVLNDLKRYRKTPLDSTLMIHIKNSGTDTEAYGQSDVEAAMTDIAYARALKSLDFVTIDSLINRMLVVKIGDENPESAYHNLATAQSRIGTFARLIRDVGPNMLVLWAGHDISTTDIGAHQSILDTDDRHTMANNATKMATGVPDPLLTGSADGGNAVAWAGFISLNSVVSELQEEWEQSITQLGLRIAEQNRFEDVELGYEFAHSLVADREANSKIMIQAYQLGMISRRTFLEELGKDFDAEKERKTREKEDGDDELFAPVLQGVGGPGGLTNPGDQPGRPEKTEDPEKIGPDRDREDKDTNKPEKRTEE